MRDCSWSRSAVACCKSRAHLLEVRASLLQQLLEMLLCGEQTLKRANLLRGLFQRLLQAHQLLAGFCRGVPF